MMNDERLRLSSYKSIVYLCVNKNFKESELISQLRLILNDNPRVVHERDEDGSTLLHLAAYYRSPVLVSQNTDLVTTANSEGMLSFHFTCVRMNVETAKYLFKVYPESISIQDCQGLTPLHLVLCKPMSENKIELVKILLDLDDDLTVVSIPDANELLPLHLATWKLEVNSDAIVKLVFNTYPEAIHATNFGGGDPLYNVRRCNRVDLVDFFEQQMELERQAHNDRTPDNNDQLPIHRALYNEVASVGGIKLMLAANLASISAADSQGHTPLHIACQIGNLDAAKYLIKVDQDSFQATDTRGNLPLHLACMRGNGKVISCILEQSTYGVTLQNSNDQTPIELLLFESLCDRNSMDYIEAVRCLFYVNPVDTLKCLTESENGKLISEVLE